MLRSKLCFLELKFALCKTSDRYDISHFAISCGSQKLLTFTNIDLFNIIWLDYKINSSKNRLALSSLTYCNEVIQPRSVLLRLSELTYKRNLNKNLV